ncbi:MAG: DUF3054 domain-containing protein [Chloroflexota bacterium]|nr:MAG: DUF3054 domain-containing protein [Chloroflexota bacterium]
MQNQANRFVLIAGDIITLAVVTVIGFASHGTANTAGARMLTTFIPLVVAWFLVAPFLNVYKSEYVLDGLQLWRPVWAMVLAAPMAAWLRGVMLSSPVLPIFVVILGSASVAGILIWRALFWLVANRLIKTNG